MDRVMAKDKNYINKIDSLYFAEKECAKSYVNPIYRFISKLIDGILIAILEIKVININEILKDYPGLNIIIFMSSFIIYQAISISIFKTTLGKSFFDITLYKGNKNLNIVESLIREFMCLFMGLALFVPPFSMINCVLNFIYNVKKKTTPWDKYNNISVVKENTKIYRKVLSIVIFVFAICFSIFY